jgi:two-component system, OmpR family, phosphate regulon response regulator PhoB
MQQRIPLRSGGRLVGRPTAIAVQSSGSGLDRASATGPMEDGGRSTIGRSPVRSAAETLVATPTLTSAAKPLVLLAGEKGFISLLKYIVENNGFTCIVTEDLTDAIALAEIERPDLIALDDILSPGSALAARQKIYQNLQTRHIPALILADGPVRAEESSMRFADRTTFIRKPFPPDAFITRLQDLVRQAAPAASSKLLRFSDIIMEHDAHRVYRNQRCVRLSPVEYRVLQQLLEYPRKVFSREKILATVRIHSVDAAARCVDVHISRIRKALCEHGEPNYIRTVRGLGYSLDAAPDGPATYSIRPKLVRAVG